MSTPVCWRSRVEDYLAYRHRLGFALVNDAGRLQQFAEFAEQLGAEHLTTTLAIQWARTSKRQTPITWARRLEVLRGFARHCLTLDAFTEIPPDGLFGKAHRRLVPHIFTAEEITALLDAAGKLPPHGGLRPVTCRVVLGLLAAAGLRISEATGLTRSDVDLRTGVLTICEAKFRKSRLVPLHSSVTAELRSYADQRDRILYRPASDHFFLLDNGKPANGNGMLYALHTLCASLGWQPRGDHRRHRLHDLRHTFIVQSTLRTYRDGGDPDRAIHALSTYVGHVKVTDTYWYLTGIPELMAIAGERFHDFANGETI
jgi:integrase/recombinase XerD